VCLAEIDRVHPGGLELRVARVVGHGKTRRAAIDQARTCRDISARRADIARL
jgi:hypothetical protein